MRRQAEHERHPPPSGPANVVRLRGRISTAPEERELPSGDVILTLRVSVPRERTPMTQGSKQQADWMDCSVWGARIRRTAGRWLAGDLVEIEGALRRRFYRGAEGTAPGSRWRSSPGDSSPGLTSGRSEGAQAGGGRLKHPARRGRTRRPDGRVADPRSSDQALQEAYDLAMLDLDGVVYVGRHAVPGAADDLGAAASGMNLAFVTNNASRPPDRGRAPDASSGWTPRAEDVVTSAQAAARVLAERLDAGARCS